MTAGLAMGLLNPLGIYLVTENLGLSKEHLQWFMAVNGVAMIVGGGVSVGISKKMSPQAMLILGLIISALSIALMGTTSLVWVALSAQFLFGLVMPAIQIGIQTMILGNTEEAFVGRVNGFLTPLFMGAMVLTMSLAGPMKKVMPLETIYLISTGLFVVGVVIMLPLLKIPNALGKKSQPSS